MKKIPFFLQIARWRMLTLFRSYFEKLQSRVVLISILALCMISPMSLSAYYQSLSSLNLSAWMLITLIGLSLISIHGKTNPAAEKIRLFERSLPITTGFRVTLDLLDSMWIQLPIVIFISIAAVTDRCNFHHTQAWSTRLGVLGATALVFVFNFFSFQHFARPFQLFSQAFRAPVFYVNESVMKTRAIIKHYSSYSWSSLIWIILFSGIGSVIAHLESPDQPKLFLYSLFFGLQILPLSKAPALLAEWDEELRPYLNTLPQDSTWPNAMIYFIPSSVLLIEASIWVILSYSRASAFISFIFVSVFSAALFFLLQMKFARWAILSGLFITLTGATALQASVK